MSNLSDDATDINWLKNWLWRFWRQQETFVDQGNNYSWQDDIIHFSLLQWGILVSDETKMKDEKDESDGWRAMEGL